MRSLCIALGIVSYASWSIAAGMQAVPEVPAPDAVPAEATMLLKGIERAAMLTDVSECDSLEPLPLYEGAPSADDWRAYCIASVTKDRAACEGVTGTMFPDLRFLCSSL